MLPETSLEESIATGKKVEAILRSFPEVVSVARMTGSAEGSEHVHPVNHSRYSIALVPREERNRGFAELTEAMRTKLDQIPGLAYIFEQPIANRLAEMLTGAEGTLSVKLFGPDLRFVVYEMRIRFRAPARLGERLDIRTRVERSSGYHVVFHQEATRAADAATIATADVDVVSLDPNGNLQELPESLSAIWTAGS